MTHAAVLAFAAVLLPAAGLALWAQLALARAEEELRSFVGFEGMHLEPDAVPPANRGGAPCPIRG